MPDNELKVGASFDVGPIVAGAKTAGDAFERLAAAVKENAQAQAILSSQISIVKQLDDVTAVSNDVLAESLRRAAVASAELAEAQAAVNAITRKSGVNFATFERNAANVVGRLAGMQAGLGMAGGAIGRMAAMLPGLGEAFLLALPVVLIAEAVEKIEQLREAQEKAVRESENLAIASFKSADAIEAENLKLQDQINKLQGFPEKNRLQEALLAAKDAADSLSTSLASAIQKANDLLNVGVFAQLFTKASGPEKDAAERLQPILNSITDARLKLAESAPGSEAGKAAIQEQIDLYEKLNHQIQLEILNMESAGTRHGQFIDADSIAKLKDFEIAATNAQRALKEMQEQAPLRTTVAKLENQKDVTSETLKQIQGIEKLNELETKRVAILVEEANTARLETARGLPELSVTDVDAKQRAMTAAIEQERSEALDLATGLYKIRLDEENEEIALFPKGSEEYKKALLKQQEDAAATRLEIATINAKYNEQIENSDRELANKRREIQLKEMEDAEKAAERMAKLQIELANQAQLQINEDEKRALAIRQAEEKASLTGLNAGPIKEALQDAFNDEQIKQYTAELAKLQGELAKAVIAAAALKNVVAGGGLLTPQQEEQLRLADEDIKRITADMEQLRTKQIALQATMKTSWQEINTAMQNALQTGVATFNQNIDRMLQTGQSFGRTMINVWNSMALAFINSVLKMVEQWIAGEILKLATTTTTNQQITTQTLAQNAVQKIDNAKTAAGKAMASVGFPLDLVVGPLVFAAALAFKEGGIVPGNQMIYAHDQEMVLPSSISKSLQGAVPAIQNFNNFMSSGAQVATTGQAAGGGSRTTTNHFHITVNNSGGGKTTKNDVIGWVRRGLRTGELP